LERVKGHLNMALELLQQCLPAIQSILVLVL